MVATRKLLSWIAGPIAVVAAVVLVPFWSFRQLEQTAEARERNNTSLRLSAELMTVMLDAETGQRGFLLTGDEAFLEPSLHARERFRSQLEQLRGAGGPGQQHLEALAVMIDAKLNFFERNVALRRADDLPTALVNVRGPDGKSLMDAIRAELREMTLLIERDRDEREVAFQASMTRLWTLLVIATLLALVIALSFVWQLRKSAGLRRAHEIHLATQQALATLQVSEERLAVTLNSIGDAVLSTDAQALITLFNPEAERLTGWKRAEAIGRPVAEVFEIINEATREPALLPVLATLERGSSQPLANHTLLIARGGSECPIADSCAPIRDPSGKVVGAVLVFRDVSADHAAQGALRDLQFYTRSLIESNVDALMTTDALGVITDANKPMELLTNLTRAELLGSAFKSHFTDPDRAAAGIELVLRQQHVSDYELTAHARGGAHTVVSYNATTFHDRQGKLQGVFAAARDITERKRLDLALHEKNTELLAATAVAEKANLAKSEFLSSMSHELRSPLNAILGFAQLIESDPGVPTATQAMGISQILKGGWHLLTLINEILDLARVESGQVPISQEPVSLAEVLVECQDMLTPQAQLNGIALIFPQLNAPSFLLADRTRLKQVLINLLSNAIKYNTANGTVTVSYELPSQDRARVTIADTGNGLAAPQLAQLFQAFNRLGQESGGVEGTGIGLVVSKRLIELMGGTIGVESTPGIGSRFWFELAVVDGPKLSEEEAARATLTRPLVVQVTSRTVLYVEDNPANLLLVKQIVSRMPGLRLLTASDGYTGIQCARASRPDAILMDINLPGINGVEAMKILRADPTTANIPVLALSANALPRDVQRGLEAGFFRYITKPINVNEFIKTLNLVLPH